MYWSFWLHCFPQSMRLGTPVKGERKGWKSEPEGLFLAWNSDKVSCRLCDALEQNDRFRGVWSRRGITWSMDPGPPHCWLGAAQGDWDFDVNSEADKTVLYLQTVYSPLRAASLTGRWEQGTSARVTTHPWSWAHIHTSSGNLSSMIFMGLFLKISLNQGKRQVTVHVCAVSLLDTTNGPISLLHH